MRVARLLGMLTHRLVTPFLAAAIALGVAAGCSDDDDFIAEASLVVVNQSDFAIYEIYLTEFDNPDWGPNLLGGDVLLPTEELVLGVPCDFYDALLVDEEGVECELFDLDLCLNDATWVIRNNTCAVFRDAAKERAAAPQAAQASTSR